MATTLSPDNIKLIQAIIEVVEGECGSAVESITVDRNVLSIEFEESLED